MIWLSSYVSYKFFFKGLNSLYTLLSEYQSPALSSFSSAVTVPRLAGPPPLCGGVCPPSRGCPRTAACPWGPGVPLAGGSTRAWAFLQPGPARSPSSAALSRRPAVMLPAAVPFSPL